MDSNYCSRRSVIAHLFDIRPVHALEILHILKENIDVQDMT